MELWPDLNNHLSCYVDLNTALSQYYTAMGTNHRHVKEVHYFVAP